MSLRSISPVTTRARRSATIAVAGLSAAMLPAQLPAVDSIDFSVQDVRAADWSASRINARMELGSDGRSQARLTVQRARFVDPLGELRDIEVLCTDPIVRMPVVSCREARIAASHSRFGRLQFVATAEFDRDRQSLMVNARGLKIGGAIWRIDATWRESGWQLTAAAERLSIAALRKLATPWMSLPADIDVNGTLSPRVSIAGRDDVERMTLAAKVESMTLNNSDGTLATDKLAWSFDATLTPSATGFDLQSRLTFTSGQAYRDPVFLDMARARLDIDLAGTWDSASQRLTLSRYTIDQPGVLRADGTAILAPLNDTTISSLSIRLEQALFPGLYTTYLQPFLVNGGLKDLVTRGALRGSAEIRDGSPVALDLVLDGIDFDDAGGHMAMHELGGHVLWRTDSGFTEPSRIAWRDGKAYGFTGGAAEIRFVAAGRGFRMLDPTLLPVFDGGVAIAAFEVRDAGTPTMSLLFDATLEPISMRRICQALGWPEFSGTVAGRIPRLTFKDKVLSLDGDLEARVFDGRMVVSKLRLEDPLGVWPRLSGNIDLERLDLQSLTGTFSFGEITGRLSGYIRGLELFAWRPVAFNAVLATPLGDRSEHRISQRAISNISAIGGGGSGNAMAALSSGVLRFFENFNYDRLGLACKLKDEVCVMQGIAPARTGYYIVRGRGVPRIDVIGTAGRIDWPQLVANLKAATTAGPADVKTGD
jgi:hypothetical protein